MDFGIIKQLNWLDIFIAILLFRVSYIAMRNGSFIESFKLCGVILGVYLSLHYYTRLANFLDRFIRVSALSIEIFDFLSLLILIIFGYLVVISLREGLRRFIKVELVSILNKWVAVVLGIFRGVLIASLVIYIFSLPVVSYLKSSAHNSYSGERLIVVAPRVYSGIWDNFMSKFMPQEDFNQAVLDVQKDYRK